MDSPSNRSMFDTFREKIWDELGPLDPNWFDELTLRASTEDGNGTEEDTCNTANQDVIFKTPFEKGALDSQLSSTPKIFRHSREESPKTEDEELFSPEREKQMLPWTDTSPCLFGTAKDCVSITKPYGDIHPQDSFELLATPQKSTAAFAQRISESLGAQINPDLSWTSSLNTPPAMSPTVILPKTEDRTGPMCLTADEHVVFVRKLFPSLSNISEVAVQSLKKSNEPTVQQAEDGHEPCPIRNSPDDSPQSSLDQCESDWRQTLPDAIEDGEIRDTVAGVLKGAENALSIFFSNSSSALRRVKAKDRIKRKQSISTKEHGCTSQELSKITSEQTTDDEKLKVPLSPHTGSNTKTEDNGITQWTPMSLFDISHCTMDTTCHDKDSAKQWETNPLTEQKKSEPDPGTLVEPSFKSIINSAVSRKTRKFVYSVQSANPQVQGKDIGLPTQKRGSSPGNQMSGQELDVKLGGNAPDEPQHYGSKNSCDVGNRLQKQGDFTEQNQVSSVPTKGQDLDVSMLCRAFAQDLTQMPESNKPGRMNEHSSQKGFSASACLSALKQRNKRLLIKPESSQRGATHHHDCTGISNRGHNSAIHLKNSKTESTMNDSGFQSTVLDVTPMTGSSLVLPSSEKDAQTRPCPSFKTGINRTIPFPLLTIEKEKALLDNIMKGTATHAMSSNLINLANLTKQRQTFGPGSDSKPYTENTFTRPPDGAKRALDMSMCVKQNGKVHTCVPQRVTVSPAVHASGFRTASNRGIKISEVNLDRAKGLFKEIEDESPKCVRNTEDEIGMTCQSLGTNITHSTHPPSSIDKCEDIQSQLTASQRADVTELCSLLEEADSQFEFTQFKPAKSPLKSQDDVPSTQRADKELDPDFLTGIDFDDSFSSDAEKHLAKTPGKTTSIPHVTNSCKAPTAKSKSTCASFYRTDKENAPTGDAPPISKVASEGIPSIESAKLRADKSDMGRDTETNKPENKNLLFNVGFKTAGGDAMSVSYKFLSKARTLFADLTENAVAISDTADSSDIGLTNWEQAQTSSDKHRGETDLTTRHQDRVEGNTTRNSNLLHIEEYTDSLSTDNHDLNNGEKIKVASSNVMESHCSKNRNEPENGKIDLTPYHGQKSGFQMTSGKGITISAKAVQEAKALFKDCDVMESNDCASANHGKLIIAPEIGSDSFKENNSSFKTAQGMRVNTYEKPVNGYIDLENVNVGPVANHTITPHHGDEQVNNVHFKKPFTNVVSRSAKTSLIEKPLSSSLSTSSTNVGTHGAMSIHGAFTTASGKKVSVSDCALTKAKSLLHDCDVFEDKKQKMDTVRSSHPTNLNQVPPPRNSGFQTASGKGVAVSTAALQKAKALLNDNNSNEEIPALSETKTTDDAHDNPEKIKCTLTTAGGIKVHVSEKNLLKARTLLNESADEESADALITPRSCQRSSFETSKSCIGDLNSFKGEGFQTASGKGVAVSTTALKKAKALLNECDGFEDKKENAKTKVGMRTSRPITPIHHPPPKNGFSTASGKGIAVSTEALQKAKALLKDNNSNEEIPALSETKTTDDAHDNPEKIKCAFTTAGGIKVHVSEKNLLKARTLLNESADEESADALITPRSCPRSSFETSKSCIGDLNSFKGEGFQTASGKGVAVSTTALKKAKALLNECDGFEDKKENAKTKVGVRTSRPITPIHHPPPKNGFSTASGKGIAVSTEALQKAKALLYDNNSNEAIPALLETKMTDDTQDNPEKIKCAFTTAGGIKVHVSEKNLLKARTLLNESAVEESADALITPRSWPTSSIETSKSCVSDLNLFNGDVLSISRNTSDLNTAIEKEEPVQEMTLQEVKSLISLHKTDNVNDGKTSRNPEVSCFSTATGKGVSLSEKAQALMFKEEEIALSKEENLHEGPEEKKHLRAPDQHVKVRLEHCGMTQTTGKVTHLSSRTKGSSMLNFESLDLSGCTVTQQKYFAQEAMDCTKALLEDEYLADQSLTMAFERLPKQDGPPVKTGAGKRSVEDTDMTEQPPLKRRLLAEFDRIVNSPRHSTLHPAKSCSDGVTKDRRAFKYNVSLHPNITGPYRDEKTFVDPRLQKAEPQPTTHSTLGDGKPSNSTMAVFIPPFHKIVKTETPKSNVPQIKARTPAFVPPFRRTTAKESSSKPPNKEDNLQHFCGTPSKTDIFVPPPKTTHSLAKSTHAERKEAIQTLDSQTVKTVDNGEIICKTLPIYHGAEDSTAQGSAAEDSSSGSQDTVQNLQSLQLARDMQDMRIRKKKRYTIRPLPGSLFLAKTSGVDRVSLRDAVDGCYPVQHTQKRLYGYGVHQHVSEINSENAESFHFNCQQFFKKEVFLDGGGVQLADGGWLIPRNDGTIGKEEFYRALCDTPGVDPKLITEEWVYNHYRWIVWKQACTERSFPAKMASLCLTPEQVLLQLKYRYDVEVDHSRRPALRKIMERDDTAAKTLVLCVCGFVSRGQDPTRQSKSDIKTPQGSDSKAESPVGIVWLTDGWYVIKAQLDVPLTAMLHRGRLAIGGKLIIHGAELVGSQDACSPLEAPESLMLKICANSSRPARWDTKLGFHRDPRPFLLPVSSLYGNGGLVGCVDIVVLRSYPVQWMEKKSDGGFVFRCSRAEEKEARRHDNNTHKAMEIVFAKIQAQFEKEENDDNKPRSRRRPLRRQDIERLLDGEELHDAAENDPGYLEACLSEQQLGTLNSYRRSLGEKRQAELQERYHRALDNTQEGEGNCPKREVTPVWKLCIADSRDQPGSKVYMLNIWRPSMDLQSLLKEGGRYRAYNLTTSEGRKGAGTATVQLTVTKKTQLQEIQASQEWLSVHFKPRISANFVDLQNPEFTSPCGEVDLVGYVITIIDGQGSSPVLYLVDGRMNFVKVRCSSPLAQSGLEDLVKPLAPLAVSNLQLRHRSSTPVPVLYAGDLAFISANPKEAHLQEALTQLRNLGKEYLRSAEERLSHLLQSDGLNSFSSPALQPRTPGCKMDARQDTRTCPVGGFGSFTPLTRNPPSVNSSAEKDPRGLKRKRGLDYLSRIPSPPPVCPLGTMASPCVNRTFNPPRSSGTPSTLKTVQTPAPKPVRQPLEDEWVNDEELAMIDTQALHGRPGFV